MPCRPYIALRTSLAVMEGHFLTSGTRALTSDRTLGLSDFMLARPRGSKNDNRRGALVRKASVTLRPICQCICILSRSLGNLSHNTLFSVLKHLNYTL